MLYVYLPENIYQIDRFKFVCPVTDGLKQINFRLPTQSDRFILRVKIFILEYVSLHYVTEIEWVCKELDLSGTE
jgi:hypothetical protein